MVWSRRFWVAPRVPRTSETVSHYTPKRVKQPDRPRWRLPVLLAAVLVSLGLLMAPNGEAHVAEAQIGRAHV